MPLPNPGLDAVPFTPLTAQFLDDMIENIESLAAGSGFDQDAIDTPSLAPGSVTGPKIDVPSVLALAYPIGSIYINAQSGTNPATLLGFGTWVSFGQGRVLAGVNPSDSDFNTAQKTGGAKTHTLTIDEIPAHNHPLGGWAHTTGSSYSHTNGAGSHNFSNQTASTNNRGGGKAHNNLQPYITVYMWRRTA